MKQKQKIILLLSSFLSGTPIIFLALRDNQQLKKNQKNNLFHKQEKKKEKEDNQEVIFHKDHQQSSSFIFWIVFIVLLLVTLAIIFLAIYKSRPKSKNEKNLLRGYLIYDQKTERFTIYIGKNPDSFNQQSIEDIFQADVTKQQSLPINPNFYQNIQKQSKIKIQNLLQEMTNFLKIYLTDQLLKDVYQVYQNEKTEYKILTTMAITMNSSNKNDQIKLYTDNEEYQEDGDAAYINTAVMDNPNKIINDYRLVFKTIFFLPHIYYLTDEQKQKHYLFKNLCRFKFFIDTLYQSLLKFMSDFQQKNNQYQNIIQCLKDSKEDINNTIKNLTQ